MNQSHEDTSQNTSYIRCEEPPAAEGLSQDSGAEAGATDGSEDLCEGSAVCSESFPTVYEGLSQVSGTVESEEALRRHEEVRRRGDEGQGQRVRRGQPASEDRAGAEDAPLLPGCVHSSHLVFETKHYVFCALCGTYGRQLRRSQLHTVCPRRPRNRFASIARDRLMVGDEPVGRSWARVSPPAVPYSAD